MQDINEGAPEGAGAAPDNCVAVTPVGSPAVETTVIQDGLGDAVAVLRSGGLVAVPTETVYGLGADARNPAALARLYKVKGRPGTHPVIVHIASAAALNEWAREVPGYARKLAARFWPGPLTLVLKRAEGVLDAVTGGQDTVGLRVPSHALAQELLQALNDNDTGDENAGAGLRYFGLAAPSANRFGRVSPTQAEHVRTDLGADVDLILDGGPCEVGIESTIVDCTGEAPVILRPGRISAADIEACAGLAVGVSGDDAPRTPGSLAAHYAPRAKLRLLKRVGIIEAITANKGQRIAVLLLEVPVPRVSAGLSIVLPAVAAGYARSLYANLRTLDAAGVDIILVESPPESPAWAAVLDRLRRAATPVEAAKTKRSRNAVAENSAKVESQDGSIPEYPIES